MADKQLDAELQYLQAVQNAWMYWNAYKLTGAQMAQYKSAAVSAAKEAGAGKQLMLKIEAEISNYKGAIDYKAVAQIETNMKTLLSGLNEAAKANAEKAAAQLAQQQRQLLLYKNQAVLSEQEALLIAWYYGLSNY